MPNSSEKKENRILGSFVDKKFMSSGVGIFMPLFVIFPRIKNIEKYSSLKKIIYKFLRNSPVSLRCRRQTQSATLAASLRPDRTVLSRRCKKGTENASVRMMWVFSRWNGKWNWWIGEFHLDLLLQSWKPNKIDRTMSLPQTLVTGSIAYLVLAVVLVGLCQASRGVGRLSKDDAAWVFFLQSFVHSCLWFIAA